MVPAVPREEPVPNVPAVSIVQVVFKAEDSLARRHSDNFLVSAPITRFARWDWPDGSGPGRSKLTPCDAH
jgi:hypothetical protein